MRKALGPALLAALVAVALAPRSKTIERQLLRDALRSGGTLEELKAVAPDDSAASSSIQAMPIVIEQPEQPGKCGRAVFEDFAGTLSPGGAKKFASNPAAFLSAANMAALRAEVGNLNATESKIAARASSDPPYVTHRLSLGRLRKVLAAGVKNAAYQTGGWIPSVEENLFGGNGCLFAAVGPYEGRPAYGEVVLVIADDTPLASAWASSGSGMKFVCTRHGFPFPCYFDEVEKNDRIAFASGIYARRDWNTRMPLAIVSHLREKPEKERRAVEAKLLAAADRRRFWDVVDQEKVGYLEAKIPEALPLKSVSEIRVPADQLGQVLSWPEAERWKDKIKAADQ